MSTPSYIDERLGSALKCWHIAPGNKPGTIALTGRQYFADGDGVTVLIRVSGNDALASDGGRTAARLADAGIDVWGTTKAAAAWTELLAAFHLREVDGRIVGRRPVKQAEQLASDIASAMLTADGLRWMVAPERESPLIRQLYDFLDAAHMHYTKRPTIRLPRGSQVRPTARVDAPTRPVIIQAVGGTEAGIEHALSLVQRIGRADYDFNQRLVILKGVPQDWPADHLDVLADHSPVGFSAQMGKVKNFLTADADLPRPLALGG
ncbi:hypothetical protein [Streptomyces fungicidicus]|uniref:hypothetical protein n=1 Tax=Streptomyces fungicidicus TaxID=68203 RepID=UPI0013CEEAFF|nr:hypothetical protein [Streptomyces fungicidicus]